jgi:PadR family transcriptional regulator PadR
MPRDYLTDFELMLWLAVLRVGEEAYGVPVAREIEASGERTVMLGAVYTGLDRPEAKD